MSHSMEQALREIEPELSTFFVKNGWINGEEGIGAITTDERQLKDGWYYLIGDDVNGTGPYLSKTEAEKRGAKLWRDMVESELYA